MIKRIIVGVAALVASFLLVLVVMAIRNDREVENIWRTLEAKPSETRFRKEMIAELPAPVQRYFLHAIKPGTPLAESVKLSMSGNFRLAPDKNWLAMNAEEIIAASGGFVWKAKIGSGILQMQGADYYANKSGRMRFFLGGMLPLVNAHSSDTNRSAIGRVAGEFIWLPSALLPQRGVSWKAINDNTIQASINIDETPTKLTIYINPDGKVQKISFLRWGEHTPDSSFTEIPFGGEFQSEQTFGGYTIPSEVSLGWWFGTDSYSDFFRAKIERAEFR